MHNPLTLPDSGKNQVTKNDKIDHKPGDLRALPDGDESLSPGTNIAGDNAACLRYRPSPMRVITSTSDLESLCRTLASSDYVTVDTEFLREQTFWPQLCLIQLAGPDIEAIVDPLHDGIDLAPFYELMADKGVVKVFHAARQDIEIVYTKAGLVPNPVFDTQVAAMVCGFGESISYVNLVKRIAGADIDKSSRFTDWSRRPLTDKQLIYALGDVTHLRDVYQALKGELDESGRTDWLQEEMQVLIDPKTYDTDPENAWQRLKLRVKGKKSLAVLVELAAWRERAAQAQDVPRAASFATTPFTTSPTRCRRRPKPLASCGHSPTGSAGRNAPAKSSMRSSRGSLATLNPCRGLSAASRCRRKPMPRWNS
jgi:ribonuclease D